MRRYIFSLLIFCTPLATTAQLSSRLEPSDYITKHWSTKDGLPVNYIADIHQTKDGFIWIATSGGLSRFDGAEFKLFLFTDQLGWPSDWIVKLHETPDSTLWAYSRDGKLAKLRNGGTQFKNLDLGSRAITLIQREDSVLIANTENRVFQIKSGLEPPQEIELLTKAPHYLQEAAISTDSTEYLAGRPGLFFRSSEDPQYRIISGFSEIEVTDIKSIGEGMLLVASEIGAGYVKEGRYTSLDSTVHFEIESDYRAFFEDSEHLYIVGSDKLYIYSEGRIYTAPNTPNLISSERYNWAVTDRNDVLWINLSDGVDSRLIRRDFQEVEDFELSEDVKIVRKLIQDHEGNLWIATTHGLFSLVPRKFKVYSTKHELPENQVFSVEIDSEDRVWIGSWGGGASVIDDGTVISYSIEHDGASNYIRSSFIDSDQTSWFGTHKGAALLRDGKVTKTIFVKEQAGSRWIHSMSASPEDIVYVATNQRLFRMINGQLENV
ncbi:MAG: two-component regulator propeller domain-containing protein, partial [Bacteroidota bacterium]